MAHLPTPPSTQAPPPGTIDDTQVILGNARVQSLPVSTLLRNGPTLPLSWLEAFKSDARTFGVSLLSRQFLGVSWKGNYLYRVASAAHALGLEIGELVWPATGEVSSAAEVTALREHVEQRAQLLKPLIHHLGEYDRDLREALNTKTFDAAILSHAFREVSDGSRFYGNDHAVIRSMLVDRLLWAGICCKTGDILEETHQAPLFHWEDTDVDRQNEIRFRLPLTRPQSWLKAAMTSLAQIGEGMGRYAVTETSMSVPGGQTMGGVQLEHLLITSLQTGRRLSQGLTILSNLTEAALGLRDLMRVVRWAFPAFHACFLTSIHCSEVKADYRRRKRSLAWPA